MALSATVKRMLNNLTPGAKKAQLGELLDSATTTKQGTVKQGVAVPNAAAAPTQADFNALLTSLRNAGIIAP